MTGLYPESVAHHATAPAWSPRRHPRDRGGGAASAGDEAPWEHRCEPAHRILQDQLGYPGFELTRTERCSGSDFRPGLARGGSTAERLLYAVSGHHSIVVSSPAGLDRMGHSPVRPAHAGSKRRRTVPSCPGRSHGQKQRPVCISPALGGEAEAGRGIASSALVRTAAQ